MATEFTLPELGENLESVEITAVLVSAGDEVAKDQPVVEVETEKASLEVPAPCAGVIDEVRIAKGDRVSVGQVLMTIAAAEAEARVGAESDGKQGEQAGDGNGEASPREDLPADSEPEPEAADAESGTSPAEPAGGGTPAPASGETTAEREAGKVVRFTRPEPQLRENEVGETVPAAPSVRRMARELGIEIGRVTGSGPGGRISVDDVKNHARQRLGGGAPPSAAAAGQPTFALPDFERWGEIERRPLDNVRRATARNMARAWATVPHVTQFDRADVTELEELRKRLGPRVAEAGAKLTVTAVILKVAAAALKRFPRFNASLDLEHGEAIFRKYVHIGVAVDTERGLLVPVIRDVDRKNIVTIATEMGKLATAARDRKIAPDDLSGSGFTVTNLGGLGTTWFSPIVNWPEVAILGVGRADRQAVWRDGRFEPRLILPLSISYDHRWIDGAAAARFLRWIAEALEQPLLLALEG